MNATMKSNQLFGRFRQKMVVAAGYFLLLLLTQALAFHPSPITPYKRNYNTIIQTRGIHNARNDVVFNTQFSDAHTHPVHVMNNNLRPQDNLFSGIAEIGMGFSIGVLYSEYFIIMTGCGPPNFSDILERICYQGVIVYAGLALFNRSVTLFSSSLEDTVDNMFGPLQPSTLLQVRIVEYLSVIAVAGAVVALQVQYSKGASMDGLSGIDINWCRAIRGDIF